VPWSGNPADRSKLNHLRRPNQQFQTTGSVLPHPGYFSDSETEHTATAAEAQRFGWGCQRFCGQQAPACAAGDRRIQEWTERNMASAVYPGSADYYTLGARRHRQLYNGTVPVINTGVIADNPITTNMNRYAICLINCSFS